MSDRHVKATDGGAEARRLILLRLGLPLTPENLRRLPWGSTGKIAAALGLARGTVSPFITGSRALTDGMRAKLAAKAKE